jgi:hypothetical protein
MLAVPSWGRKSPTFFDIAYLVWVNTLWDMSVGVLCLTQETLDLWDIWLKQFPDELPLLDLFDINQATLADWQAFLNGQAYDTTILHGACVELQAGRLSVDYITTLIEAAPAGVVVLV